MIFRAWLGLIAAAFSMVAVVADIQPRQSEPVRAAEEDADTVDLLVSSCRKMLDMQSAVYNDTRTLSKAVENTADKKPRRKDMRISLKLADRENDIVLMLDKVIAGLQTGNHAVAFPVAYQQVREDCKFVQGRLKVGDAGMKTQAIQVDIVDSLQEMVSSLTKKWPPEKLPD